MREGARDASEFDAFISYRRSDGTRAARALRKRLQSFDMSRRLKGARRKRLRVFLDTVYERGAADFYENNILPALERARFLIVLATPDAILRAGTDDWIAREIADFRRIRGADNILVVRAAGGFDDALPGDLPETLPNAQIIDLRGADGWSALSPLKASRLADEWLKLVAPLFDVSEGQMPALRREQERAQQTRLSMAFGGVLGAAAFAAGVAAIAINANFQREETIDESLFAIGQLMRDVENLPDDGPEGRRALMLVRACDLFDALAADGAPEGYLYETAVCALDRERAMRRQGRAAEADAVRVSLVAQLGDKTDTPDARAAQRVLLDADWAAAGARRSARAEAIRRLADRVRAAPTDPDLRDAFHRRLIEIARAASAPTEARDWLDWGTRTLDQAAAAEAASPEGASASEADYARLRAAVQRELARLHLTAFDDPARALRTADAALATLARSIRTAQRAGAGVTLEVLSAERDRLEDIRAEARDARPSSGRAASPTPPRAPTAAPVRTRTPLKDDEADLPAPEPLPDTARRKRVTTGKGDAAKD